MRHLTVRVAWHDSQWNGTVCRAPSCNPYCTSLERVRKERDDERELRLIGRSFSELSDEDLPPCRAESGAFMNPTAWTRTFEHPYASIKKASETHGHLRPTKVKVPPFSTFAVPFAWMLASEQEAIDATLAEALPPDEEGPFKSPWVFGRERQEALLEHFYGSLEPEHSLAFFYTKEGQPLGDEINRLILGVGRITSIAPGQPYAKESKKPTYLMWDRLFGHSIRPDGADGFLIPYHDYLEPTGDAAEDARRAGLLREIAVAADPAHIRVFSYAAELATPDVALSTLVRCLEVVRTIRRHGIAKGPWERREDWLNAQIATAWKDRGAFPGLGPALEALDFRLGTALALELMSSGMVKREDDPWPVVDALLRGKKKAPQRAYDAELKAARETWANLDDDQKALLKLLSRFALTVDQAKRVFDAKKRTSAFLAKVSDVEILENPYRIAEVDLGDGDDGPIAVGTIDRGLLPDATIAANHPVPSPSAIESPTDPRRVRAAIVTTLRRSAESGDSLVGTAEALLSVAKLDLSLPCEVGAHWPGANANHLAGVIDVVDVQVADGGTKHSALQLTELRTREERLRLILENRAEKSTPAVKANWRALLEEAIAASGHKADPKNERHQRALAEQALVLERVISRRVTALVGRAGTGKTSVMGALLRCEPIAKDGILLLAPTGKARVRLGSATNAEAMTVAQFLHRLGRYDGARQIPRFTGKEKYRKEKTVVVDECSMLTMDDLAAILEALDLVHVQRLILVGDPNQLPPIGVGRPFADFVSFLETTDKKGADGKSIADALGRLTIEVRVNTRTEQASDTLRLASWFTREPQSVDADKVLSEMELGGSFNDLDILYWKTPDELRERLLEAFERHLSVQGRADVTGFNASLGLDEKGWVPYAAHDIGEQWQILSPVRMQTHGVHELNRWIQRTFREKEIEAATNPWCTSLGDEGIVVRDKVIQTRNQKRNGFNGKTADEQYLANGEVGVAALDKNGWVNVQFARRPNVRFGYSTRDFPGGAGPLELAYALTVHKCQGSEFAKVFVVVPKSSRLLSRELLYTALTRSRDQLVLLIEGGDATVLYDLTRPERSETARRNTNLFRGSVRDQADGVPYAEHLIHRTDKGHLVRSKSELVIANMLHAMEIPYEYERVCEGSVEPGRLRPDFSFVTPAGDLIVWEHLGMLRDESYRRGWEWKRGWYERNGFVANQTLFTSEEDERGGLDSASLRKTAETIKGAL